MSFDIYLSRTVKASLARLVEQGSCLRISCFPHLEFGFSQRFFITDFKQYWPNICYQWIRRILVTSAVSSALGVDKSGLDLLWKIGEDCSPIEGIVLDPWLAARLKTSSGDIGSGGCGAVPGGSRSGAFAMRAGWPVELCPPPDARIISTASSTLCRRLSSLASNSRSWAGVSSNSMPVILVARLGRRLCTLGNRRSPSCCWWWLKCSLLPPSPLK